jgi:hypothetical protein
MSVARRLDCSVDVGVLPRRKSAVVGDAVQDLDLEFIQAKIGRRMHPST